MSEKVRILLVDVKIVEKFYRGLLSDCKQLLSFS